MNEEKVEAAKHLSDNIDMATRFNLYSQNLDSENYQVTFRLIHFFIYVEKYFIYMLSYVVLVTLHHVNKKLRTREYLGKSPSYQSRLG